MGAHARFSPSAANRLIHCPPSLVLGEAFQEEESPYAAEGSAGHALAEHLIKKHLKQQTRRPVSDYYSDDGSRIYPETMMIDDRITDAFRQAVYKLRFA